MSRRDDIERKAWAAYLAWNRYFECDARPRHADLWQAMCRAHDELGEALKEKEQHPTLFERLVRASRTA